MRLQATHPAIHPPSIHPATYLLRAKRPTPKTGETTRGETTGIPKKSVNRNAVQRGTNKQTNTPHCLPLIQNTNKVVFGNKNLRFNVKMSLFVA